MEKSKYLFGKNMVKLGKKELDDFILKVLEDGPKQRKEIENKIQKKYGSKKRRSLTNALNRLQESEMVIQDDSTNEYALYTHIPIDEAIKNIRRAVNELCEKGWRTITLDKISEYSMVPKSWSYKREGAETTFEDLAYAEVRKKTIELEDQEDSEKRPIMIGEKNEKYRDYNKMKIQTPEEAMFEKSPSVREKDLIKSLEKMFERVMKKMDKGEESSEGGVRTRVRTQEEKE